MYRRPYLQIPGPANIPEPILNALNRSAINHRGAEFAALLESNVAGLKEVFQTTNDILIFPASGSGGLEAAITNLLSPGDRVIAVNMGVFSSRFATIAKNFRANVTVLDVDWGAAITADMLRNTLQNDNNHEYKAILITHNETATGVTADIAAIRQVLDEFNHPALLLVDAVSSLAITDLPTDELKIDVVVSASQKGLMLPGGLAIISISEKAWVAQKQASMPKWYWDFAAMKQKNQIGQMPYTPAINLFYGLQAALNMLKEEGLPNVFRRHQRNADAIRAGIEALGLEFLVGEPALRSNAVTAVLMPDGIAYKDLGREMSKLGVVIGGGLQKLEGKIFRVGHLGMLHEMEVVAILGALEMALTRLGYPVKLGTATAVAMAYYLSKEVIERACP